MSLDWSGEDQRWLKKNYPNLGPRDCANNKAVPNYNPPKLLCGTTRIRGSNRRRPTPYLTFFLPQFGATCAEVGDIKKIIATESVAIIADRFKSTRSTIWAIKAERIWRDVEPR